MFLQAHLSKDLLAATDLTRLELQGRQFMNEVREHAQGNGCFVAESCGNGWSGCGGDHVTICHQPG